MSKKQKAKYNKPGDPHAGFSDQQWVQLEKAYGKAIPDVVRDAVHVRVANWLHVFEYIDAVDRKEVERRLSRIEKAARTLYYELQEIDKIDGVIIDMFMHPLKISQDELDVICKLATASSEGKDFFTEHSTPDKHSELIQWLVCDFDGNSLSTAVTRYNGSGSHNPSPFVDFVAELGQIEPRLDLRLRDNTLESNTSFSDWVYRRKNEKI